MIRWFFILVAILLIGVLALLLTVGSTGESRIEAWVGSQLKSIVNQGDRFTLEFGSIDYRAPNRVVLEDLRLSLSDREGIPSSLVEIPVGTVELAEIPRWGQPIVIRSISLVKPTVRVESFIAAAKRDPKPNRTTTRPSLSSILTLQRVEITDGTICYNDGTGSPLSWTKLNAKLDLESKRDRWHIARITIDQHPLMKADVATEIDLDTMAFRAIDLKASLDLNDPASLKFFTPPLQRLISTYQVRGHADVQVSGSFDAKQRDQTQLDGSFHLMDGHISFGQYHVPIQRVDATATVRGTQLSVEAAEASLLGGSIRSSARVAFDDRKGVDAQLVLSGLRLEELLDARLRAEPTSLRGSIDADVRVKSTVTDLGQIAQGVYNEREWATGFVSIREGRLGSLPVIAQVMKVTRSVTGLFTGKGVNRDSFKAQFRLVDESVDFSELIYNTDAFAVRGKGKVTFNGDLNLLINAGPLESLQQSLGPIGTIWGKLTDRMMSYSVTGNRKAPVVRPVLGGG
jgi:hypothetical protein